MDMKRIAKLCAFLLVIAATFYCPATIDNVETKDAAAQGECDCLRASYYSGTLATRESESILLEGFSSNTPPHITTLVKGLLGTSGWIPAHGNLRFEIDDAGRVNIFNAGSETLDYRMVISSW
jgi:hypothetical protein